MSAWTPCTCGNRKNWRVTHRNHNHSYFKAPQGAEHYSDYSEVICITPRCNGIGRTKCKYIAALPDYDEKEVARKEPKQ